jgi:hypothetical protein
VLEGGWVGGWVRQPVGSVDFSRLLGTWGWGLGPSFIFSFRFQIPGTTNRLEHVLNWLYAGAGSVN